MAKSSLQSKRAQNKLNFSEQTFFHSNAKLPYNQLGFPVAKITVASVSLMISKTKKILGKRKVEDKLTELQQNAKKVANYNEICA